MTPPTPGTRGTPAGSKLRDGYRTLMCFSLKPTISLWEKTITPPGLDTGEPIDGTTMYNLKWFTIYPRHLVRMMNFKTVFAYNPIIYTDVLAILGVEETCTVIFPNGGKLAFYGYLRNFQPQDLEEGKFPLADCEVIPTNADPVTSSEEAPVYVPPAGTY